MTRQQFTIDPDRLAAYRARADEARGAGRMAQERLNEARFRLTEAEAELRRIERSRPGSPGGVIRVDADGSRHGRFESRHQDLIDSANRRVEAAREDLRRLAAE
jgi:hypothetical protein